MPLMISRNHGPARGKGVSLIEVLVSLVILSIGVLAVAALQLIAKRNNLDAGQRTIAAQLAYDIIERMRANSGPAALNTYILNASPYPGVFVGRTQVADSVVDPNCSSTAACIGPQMALHDLLVWERALDGEAERVGTNWVGGLMYPTACITGPAGGGSGVYAVTIVWRGNVPIPDSTTVPCGDDAVGSGLIAPLNERLYGPADEFRRSVTITSYITARAS